MKSWNQLIVFVSSILIATVAQAVCNDTSITGTSPEGRYLLKNDDISIALDTRTGLRWRRCPVALMGSGDSADAIETIVDADVSALFDETCNPPIGESRLDWNQALSAAQLEVSDDESWRLPNVKELMSIIGDECHAPAVLESAFPSIPSFVNTAQDDDSDTFVDDIRIALASNMNDEPTAQENAVLETLTRLVWTSTPHMRQTDDGQALAFGQHKSWAVDINTGRLIAVRRDSKAYVYLVR